MRIYYALSIAFLAFFLVIPQINCDDTLNAQWIVIGAGPAGIAVIGVLLDTGIASDQIVWIDPEFNVGRMGKYYSNVPGNAKAQSYIDFLKACKVFNECKSQAIDYLFAIPGHQVPELKYIIKPLIDITNHLRTKVISLEDELVLLNFENDIWSAGTKKANVHATHVILATGSHPREVHYENIPQIPLDMALDKTSLSKYLNPDDIVGVMGSGHSALLIVKYLTELSVKKIMNFFIKPIVYPTPVQGGIAWYETGLKGELAVWTQTVLATNPPTNLLRIQSTPLALKELLPQCTKFIFAGGFERNELPAINNDVSMYGHYDNSSGKIGPRLFGVGIAFPEKKVDPLGNIEYLVGLTSFMSYVQRMVPEWMKKNINRSLYKFDDLFSIAVL